MSFYYRTKTEVTTAHIMRFIETIMVIYYSQEYKAAILAVLPRRGTTAFNHPLAAAV